jgi:L-ribulose-5-phosphate 4-epimerase
MLLESLREQVLHANQEIARRGLAPHTFGNASGIDRRAQAARRHQAQRRRLRQPQPPPTWSSPTSTATSSKAPCALERSRYAHAALPRIPPDRRHRPHPLRVRHLLGAGRPPIPCLGTTHADYFHGPVPVTEPLTAEEVAEAYVRNTGAVIVRSFARKISIPSPFPASWLPATPLRLGQDTRRSRRTRRRP